jgi:hypothetical protein
MSWTQPVCEDCWKKVYPGATPCKLIEPALETCCLCGAATRSGIYIRRDPAEVPFPSE